LVELELNLKSNFTKEYRATNISVQFQPPTQFRNACLITDKPAQELQVSVSSNPNLDESSNPSSDESSVTTCNWKVSNLFGKSGASCLISMAMSSMDYPETSFEKFRLHFRIDDFNFSGFSVEKFKPINIQRKNIETDRKIRTFCTSSKSCFINKL